MKKLFQVEYKPPHLCVNSCTTTYTKTQNHYIKSITGHKTKETNLNKKNRDHKKYPNKMKIHTGSLLQIQRYW